MASFDIDHLYIIIFYQSLLLESMYYSTFFDNRSISRWFSYHVQLHVTHGWLTIIVATVA